LGVRKAGRVLGYAGEASAFFVGQMLFGFFVCFVLKRASFPVGGWVAIAPNRPSIASLIRIWILNKKYNGHFNPI
jgi:hypothetical protein